MNVLIWGIILSLVLGVYAKQRISWIVAAILVVLLPCITEVGIQAIALVAWDQDVSEAFVMVRPMVVVTQLVIAFAVLYWLERREESLAVWAVGVGTLFMGLVYIGPYVAALLTP